MQDSLEFYINGHQVERFIETSTSSIYFTRNNIFKVKKSVRIDPYINYLTARDRYKASKREFEKGKLYSPEVYLSLVTLKLPNDSKLAICMKRITANTLFNCLRSPLPERLISNLFTKLYFFHAGTKIPPTGMLPYLIDMGKRFGLTLEESGLVGFAIDDFYLATVQRFVQYYHDVFPRRYKLSCIRDLHADLHTDNILVDESGFHFIDFLDFGSFFTYGDIGIDLSFLIADLIYFNIVRLDSPFINHVCKLFKTPKEILLPLISYAFLNRANVYKMQGLMELSGEYFLFSRSTMAAVRRCFN